MRNLLRNAAMAALAAAAWIAWSLCALAAGPATVCTLQTHDARLIVADNGRCMALVDKATGVDYLRAPAPLALVRREGKWHPASGARFADGCLSVDFASAKLQARIKALALPECFTFEVVSLTGPTADELVFLDLNTRLKADPEEPFAVCALALNLQTRVNALPGFQSNLHASCYPRFGFAGAKVAVLACPSSQLRRLMQEVVAAAPDLPHSALGGPWAIGPAINQGSYLFNTAHMTLDKVDRLIELVKRLGVNQVNFHGGHVFRFGDCQPNPKIYPGGHDDLKKVIDRLHAAGIKVGLHTYAFFIAKNCPWVTPVPDPRLGKDAQLTLAEDLSAAAKELKVMETTSAMSAITGFFIRNSVTLQIDDELIVYRSAAKQAPYGFAECRRGAWGTRPAAHARGAKVHHLRECFGLFVPDADSTLLTEVAAHTAEMYNRCGFDMIYLDALDGEDVLAGPENGWHYGSKFAFEIAKRLARPALMEMSTFHHHLWYIRSRLGAWDHPTRSHKKFIDLHCESNQSHRRIFMPGQLGWWSLKTWTGPQDEPTYSDDIEYLMGRCLATDTGISLQGIDPDLLTTVPALGRLAEIIRRYEQLRHSGRVPEEMKARLRTPGDEFSLVQSDDGSCRFVPVQVAKHKVQGIDGWSNVWQVENRHARQTPRLRIEALLAAAPYTSTQAVTVLDPAAADPFPQRGTSSGVTVDWAASTRTLPAGGASGALRAVSKRAGPRGAWAKLETKFEPPMSLAKQQALGVWVHGDGQGELLNVQLRSPIHVTGAIGDHYIPVDFKGWRYFELIEPEGAHHADHQWPYGGMYAIYREHVAMGQVGSLGLWLNELPPGKQVECSLGPIRAIPLVNTRLVRPTIEIGGRRLVFPVEIETGSYLEFEPPRQAVLYGPKGELLRQVEPEGELPLLESGISTIGFQCGAPEGVSARAHVTVFTRGQPLESIPKGK